MGLLPDQFWNLTPAEFNLLIRGHNERDRRRSEELLRLAWTTAVLTRAEKIPRLDQLLGREPERKKKRTVHDVIAEAKENGTWREWGGEQVGR